MWESGNFTDFNVDTIIRLWYNINMNITRAILKLRIQYAKQLKLHPADINMGLCMDFARDITEQGFGEVMWGNDLSIEYWSENLWAYCDDGLEHFAEIHCFIMYGGKFYDSECPQGCDYPDQLLCYQRNMDLLNECEDI